MSVSFETLCFLPFIIHMDDEAAAGYGENMPSGARLIPHGNEQVPSLSELRRR